MGTIDRFYLTTTPNKIKNQIQDNQKNKTQFIKRH